MLISGVTLLVVGQAAANMLMVCGCLPVIGVPLSFISYGGTSMVVSLTALGLALSVYKAEVKREKREEMLREAGMPPFKFYSSKKRFFGLFALIFTVFAIVIGRLVWLQIIRGDAMARQSMAQAMGTDVMYSPRGAIVDCNGEELAVSRKHYGKIAVC